MKKLSAFQREIKLKLRDIAEFKFTRGSWDKDAWVKSAITVSKKMKLGYEEGYQKEIERLKKT